MSDCRLFLVKKKSVYSSNPLPGPLEHELVTFIINNNIKVHI